MIYAVYGFVFGLLIPYISRRFAKFMPATMAYALVSLCKFSKKVTSEKWEKSLTYTKLRREFFTALCFAALLPRQFHILPMHILVRGDYGGSFILFGLCCCLPKSITECFCFRIF